MRPNMYFYKVGLKFIISTFKEQIRHTLMKSQLKNKCDGIKKDWMIWKKLIFETRVGWSGELETISAIVVKI
jgi:hypothetical protein